MKLYEANPRGLPTRLQPPARSPWDNEKNYLEAKSGRVGPGEAKQAAGPGQAKQAAWIGPHPSGPEGAGRVLPGTARLD